MKLAATVAFVLAVVATPREVLWAFGVHAALVGMAAAAGRVPPRFLARRLMVEVPFLLFAVFLPFFGRGERVDVLGLTLSRPGLWAAWNIAAKATIGTTAAVILAATTRVPDLLKALGRLHLPRVLVAMIGFMVRYLDVLAAELGRMRTALQSRGYRPRWIGRARALAAAAGTLFVRAYERGERVFLAMQARGYRGVMPELETPGAPAGQWLAALGPVALATATAATAWVVR